MNKRIEGSFADPGYLQEVIQQFLRQGYSARQLTILTRETDLRHAFGESGVPVKIVNDSSSGDTFWNRIVSFFTVELDDDDEDAEAGMLEERVDEEDVFEECGIARSSYQRFEEALDSGEHLLLVDEAPIEQQVSDFLVRDGIIEEGEISMTDKMKDQDKQAATPDWAENDAVKGDVNNHSVQAEKAPASQPHGAHPDPEPGETEGNHVEAEIPASQHPDPEVDEQGNEIVRDDQKEGHPGKAFEKEEGQAPAGSSQLQYDRDDSNPQLQDDSDRISTDPFGGNPEEVAEGEGGEQTEPQYDDSDHTPPAL